MKLEHKQFTADVTAKDEGVIEAIVSTFSNVDHAGEKVMPGAFKNSLAKRTPKGVWAHKWDSPIAKTLEARELLPGEKNVTGGLYIKGQFNLDTQRGREAYSDIKFGIIDEFSIGYRVTKDSRDPESKDVRQLDEIDLWEWSPVLVGMNPATELLAIKSNEVRMQVDEVTRANRPNFGGNPDPKGEYGGSNYGNVFDFPRKGIGQQFIESKQYQEFLRGRCHGESESVSLDINIKTLMTTTTGWVPQAVRSPLVVPYATPQPSVTDLIPTMQTTQNAFVYMEETTYTNAAVETLEGAAKPEATLALTQRTSPVRKIPVWIPVTDEQLEDVPGIQSWIEQKLSLMVMQRLDRQILIGDGVTPNLLGITNVVGVQTQAKGTDPTPDAVYLAMTKVQVTGQANPTAVLMHPNDWAQIRLLRTSDGIYIWGSPSEAGPARIWGLPVVLSQGLAEGVAIVGDFQNYSLLVERKGLTIKVGYQNDDFIKNQRSIVAEIRVAFVVTRPQAFCLVTGI